MSKAKWSSEKTWRFVTEYRKRDCLWNTKLVTYKDTARKHNAYMELAKLFDCEGVHDVKLKIKNLRTTFIQEYKKVQKSISVNKDGKTVAVHVPCLVWYKEMESFLPYSVSKTEPIRIDNAVIEPETNEPIEEVHVKEEVFEIDLDDKEFLNTSNTQQSSQTQLQQNTEPSRQITKKRKHDSHLQNNNNNHHTTTTATGNANNTTTTNDTYEEHEFDIFGKSVAKQLKSFSSIAAALRVQSRIQALLTEERIQDQIAASHANSQRHNSSLTINQRFFYNHESSNSNWPDSSPSATEIISVMVPSSSVQDSIVCNLTNDSCNSNSLLEENKGFDVGFINDG